MNISAEHLSRIQRRAFHSRCASILSDHYPASVDSAEDLITRISRWDTLALREGFASERSRFRYIHVSFVMGPRFPVGSPPLEAALRRRDLSPRDRSYLLEEIMLALVRSSAVARRAGGSPDPALTPGEP